MLKTMKNDSSKRPAECLQLPFIKLWAKQQLVTGIPEGFCVYVACVLSYGM